jgi:hypothetical protein
MIEEKRTYRPYRKRGTRQKGYDTKLRDRDKDFLLLDYENRVVTKAQFEQYFDLQPTSVKRRLTNLYDAGYFERKMRPTVAGLGEYYYLLDKRGAEAVSTLLGVPVKFYPSSKKLSAEGVDHAIGVGWVRVLFTKACRKHGYDLEWIPETRFRSKSWGYDKVELDGEPVGVIPDGAFYIRRNGKVSFFCLEYDRGNHQLHTFRDKLRCYIFYMRSQAFLDRFGFTPENMSLRVLTIVDTGDMTERTGLLRLKNLIEKVDDSKVKGLRPARRFWFARMQDLTPENIFSQPVWNVRPGEPPSILLEEFDPQTD